MSCSECTYHNIECEIDRMDSKRLGLNASLQSRPSSINGDAIIKKVRKLKIFRVHFRFKPSRVDKVFPYMESKLNYNDCKEQDEKKVLYKTMAVMITVYVIGMVIFFLSVL